MLVGVDTVLVALACRITPSTSVRPYDSAQASPVAHYSGLLSVPNGVHSGWGAFAYLTKRARSH